jgi:putative ABC transport system permease protein
MKRLRHLNSLDDDIRGHIEIETQDNIDRGMTPEDARHAALRKFGNIALIKEDTRAVWNPLWIEQLLQDLRYALRMLARSRGFTVVVVLTLCLGIGLNTAVFSVIRAALLRPLPYPDAERLVWLSDHDKSGNADAPIRSSVFLKWRGQAGSFEKIGAFVDLNAALITKSGTEEEQVTAAGGDFWTITGARPLLGRLFGPDESSVIVLSYDLFEQSFGGDAHVIGQVLSLDGRPVTVTGVLEKTFRLLAPVGGPKVVKRQAYIPIPHDQPAGEVSATGVVSVVAKLKPGASIEQAQTEIQTLRSHDPSDQPSFPSMQLRAMPYEERVAGDIRPILLILLASAGLVLLIAVVNIANLLLARATTRQREIGIRIAVGAGRTRVARQFLTESFLLALLGGAAGVGLAQAAIMLAVRWGPATIPRLRESRIDGGVLAFTLAISLLTAILFGFGPVLSLWRAKLNDVLKDGARNASAGHGRLRIRALLVAAELALAIILLTGAGLLLKSFWRMNTLPPGFQPERILTMRVSLSAAQYKAKPAKEAYFRTLLQRLEQAPGVESAGFEAGAITMIGPGNPFQKLAGAVKFTSASAGYVRATGMNLVAGRWLTNDEPNGVVLVNETFARTIFPGRNAIGRSIHVFRRPEESTIVGVVSDLKRFALDFDAMPEVYMPYKQFPILLNPFIAFRTTGEALSAATSLRKLVAGIDHTPPIFDVMTMEEALTDSIAPRRFNLCLLGTFAGVALLLAITGIYGVIAYSVAQRTQEIGVRMALGAQRNEVVRMVVRQGFGIAFAGIAAGLIAAAGLTRFIASLLYGVEPHDPSVFVAVALALGVTALLASWGPALRAALIDPVIALRYE